jgi:hypothetical protein
MLGIPDVGGAAVQGGWAFEPPCKEPGYPDHPVKFPNQVGGLLVQQVPLISIQILTTISPLSALGSQPQGSLLGGLDAQHHDV